MSYINEIQTQILVIGAGAAGMAAASGAAGEGAAVLLVDERPRLGGILLQCIHRGFGLGVYGKNLTGPEYCEKEAARFYASGVPFLTRAHVIRILPDRTALISSPEGLYQCFFDYCILASGCREKNLYALDISGTRPTGVYTAGEAQAMMNLGHYDIGSRAVILGSGDIGQIVARRLVLTGRKVVAMVEMKDHIGGLKRNRKECIEAYAIPVILRSTVTELHGYPRLTAVTVKQQDTGMQEDISCDMLITALGLVPDTSAADPVKGEEGYPDWLHLCGNAEYIHEIVDSVTREGLQSGRALGRSLAGKQA